MSSGWAELPEELLVQALETVRRSTQEVRVSPRCGWCAEGGRPPRGVLVTRLAQGWKTSNEAAGMLVRRCRR
jgi:hypothetical protein